MLSRPLLPVLPVRAGSIKPVTQQHNTRLRARQTAAQALLGLKGLDQPRDIDSLAEGVSKLFYSTQHSVNGHDSQDQQAADASYAQQQLHATYSCLQFIQACHPDSSWQAAAQEALHQLSSTAIYLKTAAAAAAAAAASQQEEEQGFMPPPSTPQPAVQANAASTQETRGRQLQLRSQSCRTGPAALRQLLQHAEQLNSWVTELLELQAATAAAATVIAHDPDCSPALLLDTAAAGMHPVLAKDYAAWSAAAPAGGGAEGFATMTSAAAATANGGSVTSDALPAAAAAAATAAGVGDTPSDALHAAAAAAAAAAAPGFDSSEPNAAKGWGSSTGGDSAGTPSDKVQLNPRLMLPAQPELHVGQGASLSVLQHYKAAAALIPVESSSTASTMHAADSGSSSGSSGGTCGSSSAGTSVNMAAAAAAATRGPAGPDAVLPWPLTAAATKVLLGSPLGVLPGPWLQQVYCLGLLGRVVALADAVDLARLVGGELAAAQAEQQQLGQQLTAQLQELHRAVQSGAAVDPVAMAAVASAAAATCHSSWSVGAAAAVEGHNAGDVHNAGRVPNAGVHPAVAVAFLQELAAFGKGAAAEELQTLLQICRSDPALSSYLASNEACSQLPTNPQDLQPHLVDTLRETVALALSNVSNASKVSGVSSVASRGQSAADSRQSSNSAQQQVAQELHMEGDGRSSVLSMDAGGAEGWWLQDYTHMDTLLPHICSVLGDCLQLEMSCAAAERGQTWCAEAYMISVSDKQPARNGSSSRGGSSTTSSSSSGQSRGTIWVMFDDTYHGMPATHMVSPGAPAAAATAAATAVQSAAVPVAPSDSTHRALPGSDLGEGLQTTTVAIIFPASFCSVNRGLGSTASFGSSSNGTNISSGGSGNSIEPGSSSSSSSSSGGGGSSAFSVLQSLLHELGHALHFLLSASACDEPAVGSGACSSLEIMETASHLVERMACSPVCLQAMLRHHNTQQPPHPALTQQLLTYTSISNRGVLQWHQHVLAALADAQQAASAAAAAETAVQGHDGSSSASCWTVLQSVVQQYDPLASTQHSTAMSCTASGGSTLRGQAPAHSVTNVPVVSSSMLEHLPAMAVLQPGDMYVYVCADLLAAALWGKYLQQDPLDPAAWLALRQGLFKSDARVGTVAVFEKLLGPGSMQKVSVQQQQQQQQSGRPLGTARGGGRAGGRGGGVYGGGGVSVSGWVPNLEHACFQDIDLWA